MATKKPNTTALVLQRPLKIHEVRFCQKIAEGATRHEAYTESGLPPRKSADAARMAAFRLLRRPEVRDQIRAFQRQALDTARVTADRVVQAITWLVFADRRKLFDAEGRVLPPDQWPEDVAMTVETVESEELFEVVSEGKTKRKELRGYARKVRTTKRLDALRLLVRVLRLDAAPADAGPAYGPLVVTGEASPDGA